MRGLMLKNDSFGEVYGDDEVVRTEELIDLVAPPMLSSDLLKNPELLQGCDVVMADWGALKFDEKLLEHSDALKAVFYAGGSIRGLVSDAFWERGIVVCSGYGANGVAVAQYTLAQMLSCVKNVWQVAERMKQQHITDYDVWAAQGGYKSVIGIISLGVIGRKVVELVKAVSEMTVMAYDPFASQELADGLGVELCSLDEIFERSDVVSLHTPLLPATVGMITGEHFKKMKQGASFINTARGAVVRETEMIEVLCARSDLFAVLDVTDPEPPVLDSPLYDLDNVVLTPHVSGCHGRECRRLGRYMVDELERYIAGKDLKWSISEKQAANLA